MQSISLVNSGKIPSQCAVLALVVAGILSLPLSPRIARGADYPTKPMRFIVGPGPDVLARLIGQKLTEEWGQQVVVDQRPGAGGIIAAELTANATPDGYTLLLTTGSYTINATLYKKKLPYNFLKDLSPVSLLATIPFLLVVNPTLPVHSVEDLIRLARARPGQLNCASSGTGTTAHLGCEMFQNLAKIKIVHVPFKGLAPAINDLLGGRVQLLFAVAQMGLPYVRSGKLRGLAVSGPARSSAIPELPTVAEAGVPGFAFESWNGVHVTAGTPKAVIAKLNAALVRAVNEPDMRKRMLGLGLEPVGSSVKDFAAFVRTDIATWAKVIKASGVKVE